MKKKSFPFKAWLFVFYSVLLLYYCTPTQPSGVNSKEDIVMDHLKTDKLSENLIIVRLGSDAISGVKTSNGIVVIDAGISAHLTQIYRGILESEFGQTHFCYLFNTHSHTDHIGGNQVFKDALIVGHQNSLKEFQNADIERLASGPKVLNIINSYNEKLNNSDSASADWEEAFEQKLRYEFLQKDISAGYHLLPPTKVFTDSLKLKSGETEIELVYFGKAHSRSDILIYINDPGVLFTGDLFSKYGRPSFYDSTTIDIAHWNKLREWIKVKSTKTNFIIGGHGQRLDANDLAGFIELVESKVNIK